MIWKEQTILSMNRQLICIENKDSQKVLAHSALPFFKVTWREISVALHSEAHTS